MMEKLNVTTSRAAILMVNIRPEKMGIAMSRFTSNYEVLFAFDEDKALWFLQKEMVALVIGNASNSVDRGFYLCKKIKFSREYCHIPLILLVAENSLNVKIQGFEYGADAYVETPVSTPYLEAQVDSLLKNRRRMKEYFKVESVSLSSRLTNRIDRCDEIFLHEVQSVIQQYLDNPQFDVELLAKKLYVSRPTLYRKIKSVSNFSPNDLINMARLEEALNLLSSGYRVFEVSDRVGYSSQSHFSRNFQKYYGMSPREYIANKKLSMVV